MRTASLFFLSAKHMLRLYVPDRIVRGTFLTIVTIFLFGGLVMGTIFGVHPPPQWRGGFRSPEFVANLSSLFFLLNTAIMMFPTLLAIRGSLKLLKSPETVSLILLSPVSPAGRFWSTIGPLMFFSSIPFLIVICPFIVMFIFLDPAISAVTILYFMVISGWSVVLCFGTLMLLVNFFGKSRAMQLSYALPFILLFLPLTFISTIENFREYAPVIGYWQLVFFGISLLLLPRIFAYTSKSFYTLLSTRVESVREYPEPVWGTYNPWIFLRRQASMLGMVPLGIFILLMLTRVIKLDALNEGIFALSLFSFVTAPIHIVMEEEKRNPDRWMLSPNSFALKKMIWLKLILPVLIVAAAGVIVFGAGHTTWILWVSMFLIVGSFTVAAPIIYRNPVFQGIIYFILLLGCVITQITW